MGSLKALGKNVDTRLRNLEAETEIVPPVRRGHGAPASQALLEETQEMNRKIAALRLDVRDQMDNNENFLDMMRCQMKEVAGKTFVCENFMKQYGWEDKRPIDHIESYLDWSKEPQACPSPQPDETPASAEEFQQVEDAGSAVGGADIKAEAEAQTVKMEDSPPSIFSLGLSKSTMKMIMDRKKSQAGGALAPAVPQMDPNRGCAASPPSSPLTIPSPQNLLQPKDASQQVKLELCNSPSLVLSSKLPAFASMQSDSLSQSQVLMESMEISPGLPRRRATPTVPEEPEPTLLLPPTLSSERMQAIARCAESPETPTLQTMDLRKLLANTKAQEEPKRTPEEPILTSYHVRPPSALSSSPANQVTPEMPDLQTTERNVTGSPETPVLKTVVLKKISIIR